MKSKRIFTKVCTTVIVVLLVGGCMSVFDSISSAADAVDNKVARTKASANQAVADAVGIGALEDSMIAALVYSQAFFAGGYVQGYEDFSEGEGVVWEVVSQDGENLEDNERIQIERALLKRTAEGNTWWLLRYSDEEGSELVSESLLNDEYEMLLFRYRDPETQSIREWKPENESDEEAVDKEGDEEKGKETKKTEEDKPTEDEDAAEVEAVEAAFFYGDYNDYIVGTEKVKVPAGTYKADHVKIVDSYTTENSEGKSEAHEVRYEWWIGKEVPGDLVKYEWINETEKSGIKGELIKHKKGYTTQLSSY